MNRAYRKNILRTITRSMGRYLAIFAIIALGVGFFAGLRQTKPAMIKTVGRYYQEHQLFDFRVLSTFGFTAEEIERAGRIEGVRTAAGAVFEDLIYQDEMGNSGVLRAHSLTDGVNLLDLQAGRMPDQPNELLLDASFFPESMIGTVIHVSKDNPDGTKDSLAYSEYIVTGLARSPYYLNTERGTTALGNGKLSGFAYLPEGGFSFEYYEELYLVMDHDYEVYSEAYDEAAEHWQEELEAEISALVNERYERELEQARQEIADARAELAAETAKAEAELAEAKANLEDALAEIERGERQLAEARTVLRLKEAELMEQEQVLRLQLEQARQFGAPEITAPIEAALGQIEAGLLEIEANKDDLRKRENELAKARQEWTEAAAEYEEAVQKLAQEIEGAEAEIRDAEAKLDSFAAPEIYVLPRETNAGYAAFRTDAGTVEGIGKVFPVFFFLIAALVCSTTMTRMVDDERTQIGTLRALGYSNAVIAGKYLIYAGSAAVIGCIAGYFIGIRVFPLTIWMAFDIMYGFAEITFVGDAALFAWSLAVSLLCSMGTAYAACRRELRHMPAELIRPKAPPAGKRILLERIGFIWKRMKFLHKVTARNIFRFKKRLFMMILGIAGCTALVVTGYGLRDSIMNIVDYQFDEIMHHDLSVTFTEPLTEERAEELLAEAGEGILRHALLLETTVDVMRAAGDGVSKSVFLIAADGTAMKDFVHLHLDGESVPYPQPGEAVLSRKLAEIIGAAVGDEISVRYGNTTAVLKVSGIFENYVQHYIYVAADRFAETFGEPYEPKTLYLILEEGADEYAAAATLSDLENTANVTVIQNIRSTVENTMQQMNYVILLVIFCAGALAFIVLFNLTNINITERVREIATLKVLGFFPNETRSYVFRENIVLSAMGIFVGLPLGVLLHRFVMDQIKIDMVSFQVTILPLSYVYSVLTVLAFTVFVNLLMNRKIERISMAESLKSIE